MIGTSAGRAIAVASVAVVGVLGAAFVACGEDDGFVPRTDAGAVPEAAVVNDTGVDAPIPTLYERLGGKDNIAKVVHLIVLAELKDAEIAGYFAGVGQSGHPTAEQIEACLVIQLAAAAGSRETPAYPAKAADTKGWQCRSMAVAHQGLGIKDAVFTKFVTIAAGVLKSNGVSDADIKTIGDILGTTRSDVVDKGKADAGTDAGPADAADGG
jgi:hypothetical protein